MPLSTVLLAAIRLVEDEALALDDRLRAARVVHAITSTGPVAAADVGAIDAALARCAGAPRLASAMRSCREAALRAHGVVPLRPARAHEGDPDADALATGARASRDVLKSLFQAIAEQTEKGDRFFGPRVGIAPIDLVTGGLRRGGLYAFVGPKDAPLDAALHAARVASFDELDEADEGGAARGAVVVRSHRVTAARIATRLVVARAAIAEAHLLSGRLAESEWRRLTQAATELASVTMRIEGWPCSGVPDAGDHLLRVEHDATDARVAQLAAETGEHVGPTLFALHRASDAVIDLASCVVAFEPGAPGQLVVSTLVNRHGPPMSARIAYDPESGVVGDDEIAV